MNVFLQKGKYLGDNRHFCEEMCHFFGCPTVFEFVKAKNAKKVKICPFNSNKMCMFVIEIDYEKITGVL